MEANRKKRRLRPVGLLLIALLVASAGIVSYRCGGGAKKRLNVVVIMIDTLRTDHCSLYGYERETTPNLVRIAGHGLKLENFFVNAPWTKPSVASFLTGLYPTAHGSRVGQFEDLELYVLGTPKVEILNSKIDTMAEILKANGYETHAFVTNYHMTPKFGYHQGYDHYHFDPAGAGAKEVCQSDRAMLQDAMKVLESRGTKPVFIWCHLMSVHGYRFPPEFEKFRAEQSTAIPQNALQKDRVYRFDTIEEAVCSYDNAILYADHLVGEFFDFLKENAVDTVLVVTSDHGEEFYEHGGFDHCRTLYSEILKVPCLFWGQGVPTGVFSGLSDSLDILPTLLKNLGIKIEKDLKGEVIFQRGGLARQGKGEIFAELHHRGLARRFALIKDGKKLVQNEHKESGEQTFEFYRDGLAVERDNLFSTTKKSLIDSFVRRIHYYRIETQKYFKKKVGPPSYEDLSPEDIKHLKSLGYIK